VARQTTDLLVCTRQNVGEDDKVFNMPRPNIDFYLDNARVTLGASTLIQTAIKAVSGRFISN
jgi:hypothetical protein